MTAGKVSIFSSASLRKSDFTGVEPEIREIAGDDAADLADLESHRTDLGQVILDGELVDWYQ